MVQEAA